MLARDAGACGSAAAVAAPPIHAPSPREGAAEKKVERLEIHCDSEIRRTIAAVGGVRRDDYTIAAATAARIAAIVAA
jgi:hypothetical protein